MGVEGFCVNLPLIVKEHLSLRAKEQELDHLNPILVGRRGIAAPPSPKMGFYFFEYSWRWANK
jgi:hypothetical protein